MIHQTDLSANVLAKSAILTKALGQHLEATWKPASRKQLRGFSAAEACEVLGLAPTSLRKMHYEGRIPEPSQVVNGRRLYSAEEIDAIRQIRRQGPNRADVVTPRDSAREPVQVITVMNQKGGSGKSTCCAHLAQRLALRGYRVLAIDMDPQASLTTLFGYRPEIEFAESGTIYDALRYEDPVPIGEIIRKSYFPLIDIAPAGLLLAEYEHDTPRALAQRGTTPFFARLRNCIDDVAENYDVVVVDCPPHLGYTTLSALGAATGVLVTVIPNMLDTMSMSQFLNMLGNLTETLAEHGFAMKLDFLKFVLSRFEPNDGPQSQISSLLRILFKDDVLTTPLLKSTAIADAGIDQNTVYEMDRANVNRETYNRIIESLNSCFGEVEQLILRSWGRSSYGA